MDNNRVELSDLSSDFSISVDSVLELGYSPPSFNRRNLFDSMHFMGILRMNCLFEDSFL